MATGTEIANAYVALTVKAPGIQKAVSKELGGVDTGKIGSNIGSKLASGMKKSLKVAGVAVAGVLGTAIVKGFGRLKAIETAQAKMRGLGFTGKEVTASMDAALASVKGTAFGLGEAATTASQMMAAGVKPGKDLEKVLSTVANNAAAAGTGFDEMGSIFAKAATQANGVQNDVIGQLADKGIPIYQELGKTMGVTAGEVFKLAQQGKIDFATFQTAATAAAGTVADEMGNTTTGAFDNMMAALGRLGAKILEDIFPLIGPLFKDVTKWLDDATVHVEPLVDAFGEKLKGAISGVKSGWQWMKDNSTWLAPIAVAAGAAATAIGLWQGAIKLWTVATNIAKAAQVAFNIVMNANPIMLIVSAIAALVAGLVYFFTQTDTGRRIWAEFTSFLNDTWNNVLKPVFDAIGTVVKWLWENILKPALPVRRCCSRGLAGSLPGSGTR